MSWSTRDRVRLYYEEAGDGSPPLLLIHGGGCDHTAFGPQVAHFRAKHRVVAVDLRGHGKSDAPIQEYTIPGFAADLAWLCKHLSLQQPVLIGHSLGGRIALELAARAPQLPATIVIVESTILPLSGGTDIPPLAAMLREPGYREAAREFFERTLFLPTDDPVRKAHLVQQMVGMPQHVLASAFANTFTWDGEAVAASCTVPLLLISGATVTNDLTRLHQLCPQFVHGQTVGAGHFNQLEVPDQVNAMIERFLAVSLPHRAAEASPACSHRAPDTG